MNTFKLKLDEGNFKHAKEFESLLTSLEESGAASSIGLVTYGGSIAYGLDTPESDVDLRGFFLPALNNLLMVKDIENIEVHNDIVDGALYSAKKMIELLRACNPTTIEILGMAPEHIIVASPHYDLMLANKNIFLSKDAGNRFGGYATQQLRRIENSMSRDAGDTDTEGARRSMNAAIKTFSERYGHYDQGDVKVDLVDEKDGMKSLFVSLDMKNVPIGELRGMMSELDTISKNADNLAARNRKKDTAKLSKHMSHLVRLMRMGSELMESGEINTYRTGDRELLLALKQGLWMSEDENGIRHVDDAFWDLVDEESARFEYAKKNSVLPDKRDDKAIDEMIAAIHTDVLKQELGNR